MALRVIRQIVPSGAAALRAAHISQKAGVHTSSARSLQYGWLTYFMGERTMPRLTSTSKIITLDGNLASGKGALASKLADKLGIYLTVRINF
ncbi:NADH dehydrogenase [ubiquinone] 1 alpha subcomplex subunit 10, mitochondrial-like [Notothenia coriiceps]|uniref:NADH dehydrogenase [ubiquinone] 1 alpha subcomplex subunit 10, mitochondrial-like n=1 Tax=Notothenia coriiceps TaxID=8208 RepID=A0A6I9MEX0_9TELE|nr:PREDICTED: NADH dehydrogenase [ubiquinone] 1 alpha subcomplex subunit 10, mitochondrial-like [Notothenia coriiceps]